MESLYLIDLAAQSAHCALGRDIWLWLGMRGLLADGAVALLAHWQADKIELCLPAARLSGRGMSDGHYASKGNTSFLNP